MRLIYDQSYLTYKIRRILILTYNKIYIHGVVATQYVCDYLFVYVKCMELNGTTHTHTHTHNKSRKRGIMNTSSSRHKPRMRLCWRSGASFQSRFNPKPGPPLWMGCRWWFQNEICHKSHLIRICTEHRAHTKLCVAAEHPCYCSAADPSLRAYPR